MKHNEKIIVPSLTDKRTRYVVWFEDDAFARRACPSPAAGTFRRRKRTREEAKNDEVQA